MFISWYSRRRVQGTRAGRALIFRANRGVAALPDGENTGTSSSSKKWKECACPVGKFYSAGNTSIPELSNSARCYVGAQNVRDVQLSLLEVKKNVLGQKTISERLRKMLKLIKRVYQPVLNIQNV